jgi:tRNA(Ile2) C34 agmatinyltransferase TiaS
MTEFIEITKIINGEVVVIGRVKRTGYFDEYFCPCCGQQVISEAGQESVRCSDCEPHL